MYGALITAITVECLGYTAVPVFIIIIIVITKTDRAFVILMLINLFPNDSFFN